MIFQGEQEVLARMEVEVQSARLLTWKVSSLPGFFPRRLVSYLEVWFFTWKVGLLTGRLVSSLEG